MTMSNQGQAPGICLGNETRWVINGLSDFEAFFRNLGRLLPKAEAIVYFEGVSISPDVRDFFEKHSVTAWHEVRRGTIWPKPLIFHLPATQEILSSLADLASRHAYPEIADHCHVYVKGRMILQWYDACDKGCPLGVASEIPEENVKAFCDLTGASYTAYMPD